MLDSMRMECFKITPVYFYFLWIIVACLGYLRFCGSSETIVIKRGNNLELSCNYSKGFTWWFDGMQLDNYTTIFNNTIALKISNTTSKNQGVYWCGLSWQHGLNVSVIVGDLPSLPRNLKIASIEWETFLSWTASMSTGSIPVHYTVNIQCLKYLIHNVSGMNCRQNPNRLHKVDGCELFMHSKGKEYTCNMKSADMYTLYNACVFAVNQLGNSSACIKFHRVESTNTQTLPLPPENFKAQEGRQGEVQLSWQLRKTWKIIYPVVCMLRISYSKSGDKTNKTLSIPANDLSMTISDLHADRNYAFYAEAQFTSTSSTPSNFSYPAVTTIHTRYAAPGQAPQKFTCSNISKSDSNGKRNITVSWEPPPQKYQNGPISKYLLYVSNGDGLYNQTVKGTSFVLRDIDEHKDISLHVRACTEGNLCGGTSVNIHCRGKFMKEKTPEPKTKLIIGVSLACGVGLVLILIAAVVVLVRQHSRKKKEALERDHPLPDINFEDNYPEAYQDVEGPNNIPREYATLTIAVPENEQLILKWV